jgi:hypothetical protein
MSASSASPPAAALPRLGVDGRIVEGLVTSRDASDRVHVAPMGPLVNFDLDRMVLRPFQTSTTCARLLERRVGVFHVTDDVEMVARAAVERDFPAPPWFAEPTTGGAILRDACRWYAFEVETIDLSQPRAEMTARIVCRGDLRPMLGFNRAQYAVIEAAILATRVGLLEENYLRGELERLAPLVAKTGGAHEVRAFEYLRRWIDATRH